MNPEAKQLAEFVIGAIAIFGGVIIAVLVFLSRLGLIHFGKKNEEIIVVDNNGRQQSKLICPKHEELEKEMRAMAENIAVLKDRSDWERRGRRPGQ